MSGPTRIIVYDSGQNHNDRYTACPLGGDWKSLGRLGKNGEHHYMMLCFNSVPTSPNMGVSMWGEYARGRHLGKIVPFESLPEELQRHVKARIEE